MDFMYCKRCKKLYTDGKLGFCRECILEFDRNVITIREYLAKNGRADIPEICEKTDIAEKDVLYLLKVGRLVLETSVNVMTCRKCGKPITTGKYCVECSSALENLLKNTARDMNGGKKPTESNPHSNEDTSKRDFVRGRTMGIVDRYDRNR